MTVAAPLAPAGAPIAVAPLLGRIAAVGVPGAAPPELAAPLDDGAWDQLVAGAAAERITGHLVAALGAGALPAAPHQHTAAERAHVRALARDLVLERLLLDVSGRCAAAGIEHRVLKGPALAHSAYPSPDRRSFADVDLLVRGDDFDRTVATLVAAGGRRRFDEPRPGFTRRFGKGAAVTIDHLDVDLHRTLAPGPFGLTVALDDLFVAPTPVPIGGRTLLGLGATARFLHACMHAVLGDPVPRLVPLRDVAQLARTTALDVDAVLAAAARWRVRAVVQRAVRLSRHALGLPADGPLDEFAEHYRPERFERAALRSYVAADRGYPLQAAAGVRALRGVGARAAYIRAMVVPSPDYVRDRDGGYLRRAGRALRLSRRTLR